MGIRIVRVVHLPDFRATRCRCAFEFAKLRFLNYHRSCPAAVMDGNNIIERNRNYASTRFVCVISGGNRGPYTMSCKRNTFCAARSIANGDPMLKTTIKYARKRNGGFPTETAQYRVVFIIIIIIFLLRLVSSFRLKTYFVQCLKLWKRHHIFRIYCYAFCRKKQGFFKTILRAVNTTFHFYLL